jgi:transcriptional regulator with XRE-family HTH domain
LGDAQPVPEKSISRVVAGNLRYWMAQADMSQTALAAKAGVSQKTISNYLNPDQRAESATGKMPSPKLEELDKIAKALAIPVWQLVREMTEKERRLYEHIEKAYAELTTPAEALAAAKQSPAPRRAKGWIAPVQEEPHEEGHDVRRVQDQGDAGTAGRGGRAGQKR